MEFVRYEEVPAEIAQKLSKKQRLKRIRQNNPDYPMPEGSEDGVFTMIITGEDTGFLPEIAFSSRVYTYTIQQTPGSNELATHDDSIYNLVVYVTNSELGDGLDVTVILYLLGETDKFEEVVFNNEYEAEDLPPLPETGEDPEERPPYQIPVLTHQNPPIDLDYHKPVMIQRFGLM